MTTVTITYNLTGSKLETLSKEEIGHLFQYGFFTTGNHGSCTESPFWDGENSNHAYLEFSEKVEIKEKE